MIRIMQERDNARGSTCPSVQLNKGARGHISKHLSLAKNISTFLVGQPGTTSTENAHHKGQVGILSRQRHSHLGASSRGMHQLELCPKLY